jgi:hypothetical protein
MCERVVDNGGFVRYIEKINPAFKRLQRWFRTVVWEKRKIQSLPCHYKMAKTRHSADNWTVNKIAITVVVYYLNPDARKCFMITKNVFEECVDDYDEGKALDWMGNMQTKIKKDTRRLQEGWEKNSQLHCKYFATTPNGFTWEFCNYTKWLYLGEKNN